MNITPDQIIYWQWGPVKLNATIVFTWVVMAILVGASWLVTRNLSSGTELSRGQNVLEVLVDIMRDQIREVSDQAARQYLPFIGTLFVFIAAVALLTLVPGFEAPTASLSTTAALAICVFVAVPIYGIANRGIMGYLRHYIQPTPVMLPFNIISELSRTIALAIRLFGNMLSSTMLVAIIISIVPIFFPVLLQLLGLLTGVVQAYIFAVLAMVYIASAASVQREAEQESLDESSRDRQEGGS